VLYAGTFTKTLFPSLRLGYLVVPTDLVSVFQSAKAVMNRRKGSKSGGQPLTYDFSVITEKGVTTSSD
jgi:DNA-binding transcriptional MocR family regulator